MNTEPDIGCLFWIGVMSCSAGVALYAGLAWGLLLAGFVCLALSVLYAISH